MIVSNIVKLLFLGDFLLPDPYQRCAEAEPDWNPFTDPALTALVRSHDVIVGSLDCAVGNGERPIGGDRIILRTGASAISTLRHLNMGVMSLATNHAFDFGLKGYRSTQAELAKWGIQSVGAGPTLLEASSPLITNVGGARLAWVAAADPATSAVIASPDSAGVNPLGSPDQLAALEARISELRQSSDAVIFLPHWGTEWYELPSPRQRVIGHRLVKAGADLVIGNHPHVTQVFEFIDGKALFYALGNAVAADITETGGETLKQLPPNLNSLAVSVHMTATGELLQVKAWDLCYQGLRLVVLGEHRRSFLQRLIELLKFRGPAYTTLWVLYCAFMELVFIPVRYRLIGYGAKYALKRLDFKSVVRRMHLLTQRALFK